MRSLTVTGTAGVDEVLRALYLARAHDGKKVADTRLLRYLPPHTSLTEVDTVLTAEVSAGHVSDGGGVYGLTSAGVAYSRAHRPRSRIPIY